MSFWPEDINAEETLSPSAIMQIAGDELTERTVKLIVVVEETRLDDRVVFAFNVHNVQSHTILNLFEVAHRPENPYPVVIEPPLPDILPDYLERKRFKPGTSAAIPDARDLAKAVRLLHEAGGRTVVNPWVCATPKEFKAKLTELFAQDYVKARIISLLASEATTQDEVGNIGGEDASQIGTEED